MRIGSCFGLALSLCCLALIGSGVAEAADGDLAAGEVGRDQISQDCIDLATNPRVNWRESRLATDQEIVECLSVTLGKAVGYGENARGGFDPAGQSRLTIITRDPARSVEQQILEAVTGDQPNWIVFDKVDFAEESEIGLYRLQCGNPEVQSLLGATEQECVDFRTFCANRNIAPDQCVNEFFNVRLNNGDLPIRNVPIGSNKTIDGRQSKAFFLFSGFAIGSDSNSQAVTTSRNLILTHLDFRGAGKVEDHELDPDMIRSTGESQDIWIHKNSFDLTGDSAFDVKVGARGITMSFNRLTDVERATLHGAGDSEVVSEKIRTTMHNNAFITRDARYLEFDSGRRVPLIRRGTTHLFNNFFLNYRKDVLSVRVGASVLFQENLFLVNQDLMEKDSVEDSLGELSMNLLRDIDRGNFAGSGMAVAFATRDCVVNPAARVDFTAASGQVRDILAEYSERSRAVILAQRQPSAQELVSYTNATAGKDGQIPFNSPLAMDRAAILGLPGVPCQ
jgi:pectate lyase